MNRYMLWMGYWDDPSDAPSPLGALSGFIKDMLPDPSWNDENSIATNFVRKQEIINFLDDNTIDYCFSVDMVPHHTPAIKGSTETLAVMILIDLPRSEDAIWMRFRFGILPMPENIENTKLWRAHEDDHLRGHWI